MTDTAVPFSASLPNISDVAQNTLGLGSGIDGIVVSVDRLIGGGADSPITEVLAQLQALSPALGAAAEAIASELPLALEAAAGAAPAGVVEFVSSIEVAYRTLEGWLSDSALVRAVAGGQSIEQVAMAAVADALDAFDRHRDELLAHLVTDAQAAALVEGLDAIAALGEGAPADVEQLRAFLSQHLLGLAPDALAGARAVVDGLIASLAAAQELGGSESFTAAERGLIIALGALGDAVDALDPTAAAGYDRVAAAVAALDAVITPTVQQLEDAYAAATHALAGVDIAPTLGQLATALQSLRIDAAIGADALIRPIVAVLDALVGRLRALFGPSEVADAIGRIQGQITGLFAASPLAAVQRALDDFLGDVVDAIAAVPVEAVRDAVVDMIEGIDQAARSLDLDSLGERLDGVFAEVDRVASEASSDLTSVIDQAFAALRRELDALPVQTVVSQLQQVLAEVGRLVGELRQQLQEALDQLQGAAHELEHITFQPVSDPIVAEIDELAARLGSIDPTTLSSAERIALSAGLAVLRAIDVPTLARTEVQAAFVTARSSLAGLLDRLDAVLDGLQDRIEPYRPAAIVDVALSALHDAVGVLAALDADIVLRPLRAGAAELVGQLEALDPAMLVEPLAAPYATAQDAVAALTPQAIVAPLSDLYSRVDGVLDAVDVRPLLGTLDGRRRELAAAVRSSVTNALDGLALPVAVQPFVATVADLVGMVTDAVLLEDPAAHLPALARSLGERVQPSDLFAALDPVFDELVGNLAELPDEVLVGACRGLADAVGVTLALLDPAHLEAVFADVRRSVAAASADVVTSLPARLRALDDAVGELALEAPADVAPHAAAVHARLAALVERLDRAGGGALAQLRARHVALVERVETLTATASLDGVVIAYGQVQQDVLARLPDFLRPVGHEVPALTRATVLDAFEGLRPSRLAAPIDHAIGDLLAVIAPFEDELEPAVSAFFASLADTLDLVSPTVLAAGLDPVYAALESKIAALDPATLATALDGPIGTARAALDALDPAALGVRLSASYQRATAALSGVVGGLLDRLAEVLDQALATLVDAVTAIADQLATTVRLAAADFERIVTELTEILGTGIAVRLRRIVDALSADFERELGRVIDAFATMLDSIPLAPEQAAEAVAV